MPVTYLDLFVIGIVVISALLAMLRGFTREVLAIASWAMAAIAAYAFHPLVLPYSQQYISNKTAALGVAAGAVFLATLIVAYFITAKLSDVILDSKIGALDRTLGFLFGALRGFLIAVILFMFFQWLVGEKMPSWAKEAKTRSMLQSSGEWVMSLLPNDPEGILQQLNQTPPGTNPPAETAPAPERKTDLLPAQKSQTAQNSAASTPYGAADRKDIRRLIQAQPATQQQ
jgi:membrane protein required for colicin V production